MRRGATLATVLVIVSVLAVLVFTVAQACVMHLYFSTEVDAHQHARNLAESAVAKALAQVLTSETFGSTRANGQAITVTGSGFPQGAYGFCSFNPGEAHAQSTRYSTNNLAGQGAVPGDACQVPRATLHLVGVGKVGDVTQSVEVMYYRPPFPKGLAASGPIDAEALKVVGLQPNATYPGSVGAIADDDRRPGSIFSNDRGTPAVALKNLSDISGDVAAGGTIDLAPGVKVGGEVRPKGDPQPLPDFDLAALMARAHGISGTTYIEGSVGAQTVKWFTGSTSGVIITGDLTMDGGVLFVDGSLTVLGGVQGKGLILVRDDLVVKGGTQLQADNIVAMGAGRQVTLDGEGEASYYFQGLVYAEGDMAASDITVVGCAITNSPTPGAGALQLRNVTMVQTPAGLDYSIGIPVTIHDKDHPTQNLGGGGMTITPYFDPDTGARLNKFDVRIYMPLNGLDEHWNGISYDEVKALAQQLHAPGVHIHNEAVFDTMDKHIDTVWANPRAWVLQLSPNNFFPTADKTRLLLWRAL